MFVAACGGIPAQPFRADFAAITTSDGVYSGMVRVSGWADNGDPGLCKTHPGVIIAIHNGAFTYAMSHPAVPGNPTPVYSATLDEDGTFQGASGIAGTISARVIGSHLAGTVDGTGCLYAFTADRK